MGRSWKRHTKAPTLSVDCDLQLHPGSHKAPHCTSLLHLGGYEWRCMSMLCHAQVCGVQCCKALLRCSGAPIHILHCVSLHPAWVVLRVSPAMTVGCP